VANPYFLAATNPAYADGDLIQISGSNQNDGFYVVKSVAETAPSSGIYKVQVYGSTGMPDVRPSTVAFAQNNFVAETITSPVEATSCSVSVSVVAVSDGSNFGGIAAGQLCTAKGSLAADFSARNWVEVSPSTVESVTIASGETAAEGILLAYNASGDLVLAESTTANDRYDVTAVVQKGTLSSGPASANMSVIKGRGSKPVVLFSGTAPAKGNKVYLGTSANVGKATVDIPTASGQAVVYIGRVASVISSTLARVDFVPAVKILL
jgi:hypothetical protein